MDWVYKTPRGLAMIVSLLHVGLFFVSTGISAFLIGAGAGSLTNPPIAILALVTLFVAKEAWSALLGGFVVGILSRVIGINRLEPFDLNQEIMVVVGVASIVIILLGLIDGARALLTPTTKGASS